MSVNRAVRQLHKPSPRRLAFAIALLLSGSVLRAASQAVPAAAFAAGTAIPVLFRSSLEAGKTKVGAAVEAETMQEVQLADGRTAPKGTHLLGHVVASTRLQRPISSSGGSTRNASEDSTLAFQFDSANVRGATVPIAVVLRVLASRVSATDAMTPHYLDVKDHIGTFTLIGGDLYLRTYTDVVTPGSKVVAYKNGRGVFGKLQQGSGDGLECGASTRRESLAIFSPEACGLYGFEGVAVARDSNVGNAIVLRSDRGNVNVYTYSAALLQVSGSR